MEKFETIDNYYILAFAYRVYDAKWVKEGLILENNPYDVTAQENEEKLSRICFQLMYAMNSYYEKGMINLTAISEYDIYQAAYSYTLDLLEKNQSNLIEISHQITRKTYWKLHNSTRMLWAVRAEKLNIISLPDRKSASSGIRNCDRRKRLFWCVPDA